MALREQQTQSQLWPPLQHDFGQPSPLVRLRLPFLPREGLEISKRVFPCSSIFLGSWITDTESVPHGTLYGSFDINFHCPIVPPPSEVPNSLSAFGISPHRANSQEVMGQGWGARYDTAITSGGR